MNNDTIDIQAVLNLCDNTAEVTDITSSENTLTASVRKRIPECICPTCGSRMLSKGPRTRTVNHPILGDGRKLILKITTTKWHCRNCQTYSYEQFSFLQKNHHNTNLTVLLILDKMKRIDNTASAIAADLNVSDTYVHQIFMRYVNLERLPLPEVLCIDEVHLKFDKRNLYATVLLDWKTGDVIDILPNRFYETIHNYFMKIPREERKKVKFLVSDMYETYTELAGNLLPEAKSVIDCFHHTQPIITKITTYIHNVRKKYLERDRKRLEEENYRNNRDWKTRKDSREVYLLKTYDWLLYKNLDDIDYTPRWIESKKYWFRLEDIEKEFMELDPNFRKIRELKEEYIRFTRSHVNDPAGAAAELDELIAMYKNSGLAMFREFADTLDNHREGIINSFYYLTAERRDHNTEVLRRISNGMAESYNNFPKDLKRNSNGVSNFEYTRNRLLWANRKNPPMLAVPRTLEEIHSDGKKRGPYKKKPK